MEKFLVFKVDLWSTNVYFLTSALKRSKSPVGRLYLRHLSITSGFRGVKSTAVKCIWAAARPLPMPCTEGSDPLMALACPLSKLSFPPAPPSPTSLYLFSHILHHSIPERPSALLPSLHASLSPPPPSSFPIFPPLTKKKFTGQLGKSQRSPRNLPVTAVMTEDSWLWLVWRGWIVALRAAADGTSVYSGYDASKNRN